MNNNKSNLMTPQKNDKKKKVKDVLQRLPVLSSCG